MFIKFKFCYIMFIEKHKWIDSLDFINYFVIKSWMII
jgi:hypothetical protein